MGDKLWLVRRFLYGIAAFIILLFTAVVLSAPYREDSKPTALDRPSPSPRELPRPDEKEAKANTENDANKPHGSVTNPVVIKVLPETKTEAEARKEEYESNEKPSLDRGLTSYTLWLAFFTAALFAAAAAQVGLFWWQLRLIRDSLADGRKAADAAKASADAAHKSADIAAKIELPILQISRYDLFRSDVPSTNREELGRHMQVRVRLKNNGRSFAEISEQCIEAKVAPRLPETPFYRDRYPASPSTNIHPKGTLDWPYLFDITETELNDLRARRTWLWVYGFFAYTDFIGESHEMRFCAMYHTDSRRFVFSGETPAAYVRRT